MAQPSPLRTLRRCATCHRVDEGDVCPWCASTTWEVYTDADVRAEDLSAEIAAQLDERRTGIPRPAPPSAPGASREAAPVEPGALRGKPRRISGFALGMIVALVRRLSALCTAEGASITVAITPDGAVVRFDGAATPDHTAAKPSPDGWRYLDIEGEPVSVCWMQS